MDWFNSYGGRMNDGGQLKQPGYRDIPDEVVEEFVARHPEGASLEAISQVTGLTTQRIGVLVRKALEKLRRACERRDITAADIPVRESVWDRLESS